MNNTSDPMAVATLVATLFLLFLPVLLIASKGRMALQIAALLLCFFSIASLVLSVGTGSSSGLTLMFALPVAGAIWFAGLLCALAAWADAAQERRMKEMTLRLLQNDPRGLGHPGDYPNWKI